MANNNDKMEINCCGIRMMTQKERYERFRSDVMSAKEDLLGATSAEGVKSAIDRLATMMEYSVKDVHLKDIYNWTADINGTIHSIVMRDYTRKQMADLINSMLESVNSLIATEQEKEDAEKLRKFFLACADNAEQIGKLVNISEIFG